MGDKAGDDDNNEDKDNDNHNNDNDDFATGCNNEDNVK